MSKAQTPAEDVQPIGGYGPGGHKGGALAGRSAARRDLLPVALRRIKRLKWQPFMNTFIRLSLDRPSHRERFRQTSRTIVEPKPRSVLNKHVNKRWP